jgi:alkylated DNA repair dioxygenase AlkB
VKQACLFDDIPSLPPGYVYEPDFISLDEERILLTEISKLCLHEAKYKSYIAKRRIVSYGGVYDFSTNELIPAGPIPSFLEPLLERVSRWSEIPASRFTHALISEYRTGTQLGWHRDVPEFETIVGVSIGASCRMRLRPNPPPKNHVTPLQIHLEPRSVYLIQGAARWGWQHSIAPTKTLRYSITFRNSNGPGRDEEAPAERGCPARCRGENDSEGRPQGRQSRETSDGAFAAACRGGRGRGES